MKFKESHLQQSEGLVRLSNHHRGIPLFKYILLTDKDEPKSYDEVFQLKDSVKWELDMKY